MTDGPRIATVAALAGDPGRANMLVALLGHGALTASELAAEAGIGASTASAHLAKLEAGGLVAAVRQGRHRYFQLADADVGRLLEAMMGVAGRAGHVPVRPGPAERSLRKARVCYDHLAGDMGVALFEALLRGGRLAQGRDGISVTAEGAAYFQGLAITLEGRSRRPLCRMCLDWSVRRHHLAGRLGADLLTLIYARGWAERARDSRAVLFTARGGREFTRCFGIATATD